MIGKDLTDEALKTINARGKNYGDIQQNHDLISLGADVIVKQAIKREGKVTGKDFALIMIWCKIVRLLSNPWHWDSIVDIVGYAITYYKNLKKKD